MNISFRSAAFSDHGLDYEDRDTRNFTGTNIMFDIEELDTTFGLINLVQVEVNGSGEDFTLGTFKLQTNAVLKRPFSGVKTHVFKTVDQRSEHYFDVEICRAVNAYIEKHHDNVIEALIADQDADF